VLWELGADVVEIGTSPNGFNINAKCGSTAPAAMCAAILEQHADLGIALDGDADRLVLADEGGELIDGDQILALLATSWRAQAVLQGDGVVATTMSNLGLERYLQSLDLTLDRTQVGDRYVVERMRQSGRNLGGEQSGHIIMTDFATTGDGLLAGLQVLAVMRRQKRPMSEFGRAFQPLPQQLRNCRLNGGSPLAKPDVRRCIAAAEARLDGRGRILVRPSGTEPLIRVMVEADDETLLLGVLDEVAGIIERYA
jgi:phosphoglucosamine mutase